MTTLLNALVNGREHGKLARGYERLSSLSVSRSSLITSTKVDRSRCPEIKLSGNSRERRACNKSHTDRCEIIADRYVTVRGIRACDSRRCLAVNVDRSRAQTCTRATNNRPINSRAVWTSVPRFRSGCLKTRTPFSRLAAKRFPCRVSIRVVLLEIYNICRRCLFRGKHARIKHA